VDNKQRFPMTIQGAKELREEVEFLKHVERPKVIQAIAEARSQGDLSENADYTAAREQQSFIEGRIADLESKLSLAEIIDVTKLPQTGKVVFGTTVTIRNLDTDEELIYKIVGNDESDLKKHKISIGSPIARAMIGKEKGNEITVIAPAGEVQYEIVKVEYI
jgi:transcription elongation factor GreA